MSRLTLEEELVFRPFWSPDGRSVLYFTGPSPEDRNLWQVIGNGAGEPELVLDPERPIIQGQWSEDGAWLVLRTGATTAMGVGLRDIVGYRPAEADTLVPLFATEFDEESPTLSPDGRWLAYSSDASGQHEVYVNPLPDLRTRRQVSRAGGIGPVWARNGTELFYVESDSRTLISVPINRETGVVEQRTPLFVLPASLWMDYTTYFYDITSDDQRFLMARRRSGGSDTSPEFVLVQNFFEELKRLVPN